MAASDGPVSGGGPEPGGPLSDRQKARLKLLGALLLVGFLSIRVGKLGDWAWEARGVGRSAITLLTSSFNIDFSVLFPAGLVTGWLVLFARDRTKKLQRLPAILAFLLFSAWVVVVENRWIEHVAWGKFWYVPLSGLFVGLGTGIAPQLTGDRRRREYPAAAAGLFLVAAGLCIVAFLDVHVIASGRVTVASANVLPGPKSLIGTIIDVLSTVGFVGLFGWFLLYSDYRSVVVLGTSRNLGIAVMAGLLDLTQQRYNGVSGEGGETLSDARYPLEQGQWPDESLVDNGGRDLEFVYLPPTPPSRWVHVSAAPISIGQLAEDTIDRIGDRAGTPGPIQRIVWFVIDHFLPGGFERLLVSDTGLLVDRLSEADVLMFVVSIRDFDGYEPSVDPTLAVLSPPEELHRFTSLCQSVGDSRKKIIVVADAHEVLDLGDAGAVTDTGFSGFVRGQLLDVGDEFSVVPVSWSNEGGGDGQLIDGIEELRRELDN